MKLLKNPLIKDFHSKKLIDKKNLLVFQNEIRDAKIRVLFDKKEKIYFLEKIINKKKYNTGLANLKKGSRKINSAFKNQKLIDAKRRYLDFKKNIRNKKILDYGCGFGEFLKYSSQQTSNIYGYEHDLDRRKYLKKTNISQIYELNEYHDFFDYIFLFHVLEHMHNPFEELKNLKKTLKKKGKLIIEVPNSKDFLLELPELKSFKKFTFWSDHLILFNEKFLKKFLIKVGFKKIKISHLQRYNFSNHLGWFILNKPGGHEILKKFSNKKINTDYEKFLKITKQTDTLIATIEN